MSMRTSRAATSMVLGCLALLSCAIAGGGESTQLEARITKVNDVVLEGDLGTPERPIAVPRINTIRGKAKDVPLDKYLWIVLHPEQSFYWPQLCQLQVNPRSGDWNQTVYVGPEGGDYDKRFDVLLLLCDEEAHHRFASWQETGDRTGRYPGISLPSGVRVLDIVVVRKSLKEVKAREGRS